MDEKAIRTNIHPVACQRGLKDPLLTITLCARNEKQDKTKGI